MTGTVYIVGAGLSGLSAAVALSRQGVRVEVIEASPAAGGRCRSYFEPALGQIIDNGNHLILSGNDAVHNYLRTIGSSENFLGPAHAEFAFADMKTGARWTIRMNDGAMPWWTLSKRRRVPGTRFLDYAALRGLMETGDVRSAHGVLWERLLQPVLLAALNTDPDKAAPRLIATVLRETLAKGGRACRPRIASPHLAAALVDPALTFVKSKGGVFRFGQRLRNFAFDGPSVHGLDLGETTLPVSYDDRVVLAAPPWIATSLVPGIAAPDDFRAIVSGHFKIAPPQSTPPITGLIGGTVEWVFAFPDRVSVTISNADRLADQDRETLAALCWRDVARLLRLPDALPPWQIVKEKRATFAATPEQEAKRPGPRTQWRNLFLAGDWTDTGLPATIEGAVRSGKRAAELALGQSLV